MMQHLIDEISKLHYKYITNDDDPDATVCVGLTQPPYEGVIVQYGNMDISEDEDNDEARLSFTYKVVESPIEEGLLDDAFNDYLGAILHHIVEDAVKRASESGEKIIGTKDSNNDTAESDQ